MQNYADKNDNYFAHARREIAPCLPQKCGRVLEIGCGSGATLAWLRQAGRASCTVGVEIAEAAAQSARDHADEVFCLDFERGEIPVANAKFDVILCLDVLEHMVNPWQAIDRLVSLYLVPGGTMVVSLPNVGHYSVVLPLLFQGRWDYAQAGLLDRTHLRFFTRKSAKHLLSHPDLEAARCMARGFERSSLKGIFNMLTFGIFADLLTYQYYLTVCKKV
ncbi:MAG: class I SAM-dependent methyltransferase [Rhodoferax sp.]|jgi:2-polyprenyl-3-methyl-5-hydroxy-6-metoxy-1,4-benzoquinol methylase|nr:class I SAM-dependent methyltransferase [Rhodoferax sp.]MBP9061334.1 class I SAM-dependent methyltransferase [Rhodoferax sp.]MBP9683688.1 class I SAM-dependent methyltransferase [Rhodoferax sp.]